MNKPKIHINSEKNIALKTRTHSPTSNSPNASNRSKICPIGAEKTCKIKPKKKWEQKNTATESRAFSRVRTHRNANTSVYRSTESPKRTKQQNRKQQQQQQQRWSTIKRKEREPQSHISPSFPSRRRRFWSSPSPPSLRPIQLSASLSPNQWREREKLWTKRSRCCNWIPAHSARENAHVRTKKNGGNCLSVTEDWRVRATRKIYIIYLNKWKLVRTAKNWVLKEAMRGERERKKIVERKNVML